MLPLNGTKTHPLSKHALKVLQALRERGSQPTQGINAGVVNRFHRERLTKTVQRPSPFAAHKGRKCDHEQITEAGRSALAAGDGRGRALLREGRRGNCHRFVPWPGSAICRNHLTSEKAP